MLKTAWFQKLFGQSCDYYVCDRQAITKARNWEMEPERHLFERLGNLGASSLATPGQACVDVLRGVEAERTIGCTPSELANFLGQNYQKSTANNQFNLLVMFETGNQQSNRKSIRSRFLFWRLDSFRGRTLHLRNALSSTKGKVIALVGGDPCDQNSNLLSGKVYTKEFRSRALGKYFLVGEQQAHLEKDCLITGASSQIRRLHKLQRSVHQAMEDFLSILEQVNGTVLIPHKSTLLEMLCLLLQVTEGLCSHSRLAPTLGELRRLLVRLRANKIQGQKQAKTPRGLVPFFQYFTSSMCVLVRKIIQSLFLVEEYFSGSIADQTEAKILQSINRLRVRNSKFVLAGMVEDKLAQSQMLPETCLTCESKILPDQMQNHLKLCKTRIDIGEYISQLDGEINAKLCDLNAYIASVKKTLKDKTKYQAEKSKKPKGIYNLPNHARTLGREILDSDSDQSCSSTKSHKGPSRSLNQLTIQQLSNYINVVEQLKRIGVKIRAQRSVVNLSLLSELGDVKSSILPRLTRANIKAPIIDKLVELLSSRRSCMRKLKKVMCNARQEGQNTLEDIYFHNEYEDLLSTTTSLKMKKSERHFSQDQGPGVSNQSHKNTVGLNDFRKLRYLAKGQYGEVFLVRKKRTGVVYAMKRIPIQDIQKSPENIRNECSTLSVVSSPFIVKAVFSFTEDSHHYFVMEYMPNGDFSELLKYEKRLYQQEARLYLAEIATAINDLHKEGVVHRDIKPQNILISQTGHVKLSDFGLSEPGSIKREKQQQKKRMLSQFVIEQVMNKERHNNRTMRDKVVGSPYFMSPQVLSHQPTTKMSDWWSFGILVFEILVGITPFRGESLDEIAQQVFQRNIWPSEIKFGLTEDCISFNAKDLIERLLILNPEQRIGNTFEQIKSHPFFQGIAWDNLLESTPPFEFEEPLQQKSQGREMSDKASCFGSTNPDLKLIRRDILSEETRVIHQRKVEEAGRLKKLIQKLRGQ